MMYFIPVARQGGQEQDGGSDRVRLPDGYAFLSLPGNARQLIVANKLEQLTLWEKDGMLVVSGRAMH